MTMKFNLLLASASTAGAAAIAVLAMQAPASAQSMNATTNYRADLRALPNTSGQGSAMLRLSADQRTLTVMIRASGLERGGPHVSHIHGRTADGQAVDSTCPTLAQDSDRDGFVELAEGQVTYGPILLDFGNIDPNQDGVINFTKTIQLSGSDGVVPLVKRHIVIHGMSVGAVGAGTPGEVDGSAGYKAVLPVLCGEIVGVGGGRDNGRDRQPRRPRN